MIAVKKVLITGATGFIGGRLVEKLILYHGVEVRTLVRDFAHASRIARFNVEMVEGSTTDADAVDRAVASCDTVFHCAHDWQDSQRNLDGARAVAEACLRHKVRRLVHVSSISVYEPLPDGDVDESTPAEPCGWSYPDTKLAEERIVLQYGDEHGLPLVVLQPTIVYGPFAKSWTIGPVARLRTGRLALPDNGGLCNAVYVDDVVDALILASQNDRAVGQRFLISGSEPVTWRDFYAAYERMIRIKSIVLMPIEEIEQIAEQIAQRGRDLTSNPRLLGQGPGRIVHRAVNWTPVRRSYSQTGGSFTKKQRRLCPLHCISRTNHALLCCAPARALGSIKHNSYSVTGRRSTLTEA